MNACFPPPPSSRGPEYVEKNKKKHASRERVRGRARATAKRASKNASGPKQSTCPLNIESTKREKNKTRIARATSQRASNSKMREKKRRRSNQSTRPMNTEGQKISFARTNPSRPRCSLLLYTVVVQCEDGNCCDKKKKCEKKIVHLFIRSLVHSFVCSFVRWLH